MSEYEWKPEPEDLHFRFDNANEIGIVSVSVKKEKRLLRVCCYCGKSKSLLKYFVSIKMPRLTLCAFPGLYCSHDCFKNALEDISKLADDYVKKFGF